MEYLGMVPEYMQEKRPPVITTKGLGSFLKELGFDLASKVGNVGLSQRDSTSLALVYSREKAVIS
jgi:hypothetical protein